MVRFSLLGPIELVRDDGTSVQSVLTQPKRVALLAYLCLANPGGFIRRDTLLAMFWPESDEAHARRSLNQAIYFLRRSLGEDVIVSRGDEEVAVDTARVTVDVLELRAAAERGDGEAAAALAGSELMSGFHAGIGPEFEHWLDDVRSRARKRRALPGHVPEARSRARVSTQVPHAAGSSVKGDARLRLAGRVAVAAAVVLALSGGLIATMHYDRRPDGALDVRRVVVLPARISGVEPSLHYLQEGMIDLVSAKVDAGTGFSAVNPRAILLALQRRGDSGETLDEGLAAARRLGAARVVATELVGGPGALTISARLIDASRGDRKSSVEVAGPESALDSLLTVLTVRLLALDVGEGIHRIPSLSASPHALRAYLRGRTAFRAGSPEKAQHHFREAVEHDSLFVLAAFAHVEASHFAIEGQRDGFSRTTSRIASNYRERLSSRDRAMLEALLGPEYPREFETAEEAIAAAANNFVRGFRGPEQWALLADRLFHHGLAVEEPVPARMAEEAFARALELDPGFPNVHDHLAQLLLRRGDSAGLRQLVLDRERALSGAGDETLVPLSWLRHFALGDAPPAEPALLGTSLDDEATMVLLTAATMHSGLDPAPVAAMLKRLDHGPAPAEHYRGVLMWRWVLAVTGGRPTEAAYHRSRQLPIVQGIWGMAESLFGDAPEDGPASFALAQSELGSFPMAAPPEARLLWFNRSCQAALWDATRGPGDYAAATARLFLSAPAGGALPVHAGVEACRALLVAIAAVRSGDPLAVELVAQADSLIRKGPLRLGHTRDHLNMILAGAYERIGDPAGALRALRRAESPLHGPQSHLAAKLRDQGRLAAALGHREEAAAAYRRYLTLRRYAAPHLKRADDPIRQALSALAAVR